MKHTIDTNVLQALINVAMELPYNKVDAILKQVIASAQPVQEATPIQPSELSAEELMEAEALQDGESLDSQVSDAETTENVTNE